MAKKSEAQETLNQTLVFGEEKKHSWLMRAEEDDKNPLVTSIYLMKKRIPQRPSTVVIVMKVMCLAGFLLLATTSAKAGPHPDANGCYTNDWFYPFLLGQSCSHPALGDPDHQFNTISRPTPPKEPPPHECHYQSKRSN